MTTSSKVFRQPATYLGDGVYASFDGLQIWLQVERAREDDSIYLEEIALESKTLEALLAYIYHLPRPAQ